MSLAHCPTCDLYLRAGEDCLHIGKAMRWPRDFDGAHHAIRDASKALETPGTIPPTLPEAGQTTRGVGAVPTTSGPARLFVSFHSAGVTRGH